MLNAFPKSRQSGFSLIELMVGFVIMAILVGIAMPAFRTWLQNSQIRNAAESIQNGLQRARAEAVSRNTNVEFILGAGSSWVVKVAGGNDIESRSSSEGSKNVTVAATPPGATTVTFNILGSVGVPPTQLNGDGSAPFTRVDLTAPGGTRDLRIMIGLGGNARMCDPSASAPSPRACQ